MKQDLQNDLEIARADIKLYAKRKKKQAENSGGHEDPYVDVNDINRKFKNIPDGMWSELQSLLDWQWIG